MIISYLGASGDSHPYLSADMFGNTDIFGKCGGKLITADKSA